MISGFKIFPVVYLLYVFLTLKYVALLFIDKPHKACFIRHNIKIAVERVYTYDNVIR